MNQPTLYSSNNESLYEPELSNLLARSNHIKDFKFGRLAGTWLDGEVVKALFTNHQPHYLVFIDAIDFRSLVDALQRIDPRRLQCLTSLTMNLKSETVSSSLVPSVLRCFKNIVFLSLISMNFSLLDFQAVCAIVGDSSVLSSLDLSRNQLSKGYVQSLVTAMQVKNNVKKLTLNYCFMPDSAAKPLLLSLQKKRCALRHLYLNGNHLEGAHAALLISTNKLETLTLTENAFTGAAIQKMYESLADNDTLTTLAIGCERCEMRPTRLKTLPPNVMTRNHTLEELSLISVVLSNEFYETLFIDLCTNTTMRFLRLDPNQLSFVPSAPLVALLTSNRALSTLHLGHANFTPLHDGRLISAAMRNNPSLVQFLGGCAFTGRNRHNLHLKTLSLASLAFDRFVERLPI